MYKIVEINGIIREQICKDGKPSKYGEAKIFKTKKDAQKWIDSKSYKGMTHKYEIVSA